MVHGCQDTWSDGAVMGHVRVPGLCENSENP